MNQNRSMKCVWGARVGFDGVPSYVSLLPRGAFARFGWQDSAFCSDLAGYAYSSPDSLPLVGLFRDRSSWNPFICLDTGARGEYSTHAWPFRT